MDYCTRRVRRLLNYCYVQLRPIRRQLRNPETRAIVLKWAITGTVLYIVMYITFFILSRHKYLLGFDDYETDLLMKQYERDLQSCWHRPDNPSGSNVTLEDPLRSWSAELSYVTLNSSVHGSRPELLTQGIRRPARTVLRVPFEAVAQSPSSTNFPSNLLDAGSCIAHSSTVDTNSAYLRESTEESGELRCLPSFIIAGAMKCGTGELMKWLQLHPKLALGTGAGDQREVHFFTSARGSAGSVGDADNAVLHPAKLLEYVQYFPAFSAAEARETYTFEKSPDYIREHLALRNLHALLPSVKIVLLLRNPSLRALSEFNHHCRHGRYARVTKEVRTATGEHCLVGDVVRVDGHGGADSSASSGVATLPKGTYEVLQYPCSAEDAERYFLRGIGANHVMGSRRRRQLIENGTASDDGNMGASVVRQVPEIEHGYYEHQLRKLLELFPAGQVLVLLQEDMYRHTFSTLREVERFLQLPCFDYQDFVLRQPLSPEALLLRQQEMEDGGEGGGGGTGREIGIGTEEDDGFNEGAVGAGGGGDKEQDTALLRPPKRVPTTVAEQVAHYRSELQAFLSSWRGTVQQNKHLYALTSPRFRHWLDDTVYKQHNVRLAALLHGELGRAAFSEQHLREMGWVL